MTAVLEVDGLTGGYDSTVVVRDVSFSVAQGEIVALLGPNGAGKTTSLLLTTGILTPRSGTVRLSGKTVSGLRPQQVARMGLTLVPDDRGIFGQLTVAENLRLARRSGGVISLSQILEFLPKLDELMGRKTALLSGGEQQMLALAKGLTTSPDVLLIDELSMGLAPIIVQDLFRTVQQLSSELGIATVLVEQHVGLALGAASRGIVLNRGRIVLDMPSSELLGRRDILEQAYLSGEVSASPTQP